MSERDLIERISAATGPDRALDAEIAAFVKQCSRNAPAWVRNWQGLWAPAPKVNSGAVALWHDSGELSVWWNAPEFTASIDAALTLVPEGLNWLIGRGRARPDEPLYGVQLLDGERVVAGAENNATPALAICAAALKARMM